MSTLTFRVTSGENFRIDFHCPCPDTSTGVSDKPNIPNWRVWSVEKSWKNNFWKKSIFYYYYNDDFHPKTMDFRYFIYEKPLNQRFLRWKSLMKHRFRVDMSWNCFAHLKEHAKLTYESCYYDRYCCIDAHLKFRSWKLKLFKNPRFFWYLMYEKP